MPPKTRTTTRKKPVPDGVLRLDRKENVDLLAEREPIFAIGDTVYTILKHVPASVTLTATELALDPLQGEAVALEYALTTMLGEDGYQALKTCPTLTVADFEFVVRTVADKVIPPKAS